jgi:hypothetical protein
LKFDLNLSQMKILIMYLNSQERPPASSLKPQAV